MIAAIEYEDLKPFIPLLIEDLRKEFEKEVFLTYPDGLAKHFGDGELSQKTKKRAYTQWVKPGFPRVDKGDGVRGVYLSQLKEFLKK